MRKPTLVLCFILFVYSTIFADQITKVSTTAAPFLNAEIGARAVGMGGAYVAVSEDATGMFWNPSGIARVEKNEVVFHHSRWLADIRFNYAGLVVPVDRIGSIGINAKFMTMGQMERTTVQQPEGTGEMFGAGSYAVGLTFARSLTDRFSFGASFKYIHEYIYHSSSHGMAFDLGALFDTQFSGLKLGVSITNYGAKMGMSGRDMLTQVDVDPTITGNNNTINANLATDKFDLPLLFRVGVAIDVLKGAGNKNLILALDALHPNDNAENMNLGAEFVFNQTFSLRAGYAALFAPDSEQGFSFGAGIHQNFGNLELSIDYAYRDFGILHQIQMISTSIRF